MCPGPQKKHNAGMKDIPIYFKGTNFRGYKLSRCQKKREIFGINFRGWDLVENFAGINFRGERV